MSHSEIARIALALLCVAQGLGTVAVDLNRTHASNPLWPGHARFHLVWQAVSYALLSLIEVALILMTGPFPEQRFYLAALLASVPMLSFLAAVLLTRIYGGALSDPNGIPPLSMRVFGSGKTIDLNLTVEFVALLMLLGIVLLFTR